MSIIQKSLIGYLINQNNEIAKQKLDIEKLSDNIRGIESGEILFRRFRELAENK